MEKVWRNDRCICGSGKKHKHCCDKNNQKKITEQRKGLYDMIADGDLPFYARIVSNNGEVSSMEISNADIIIKWQTKKIIDDKIILSTNMVSGDTIKSSATLTIPIDSNQESNIDIQGNASAGNGNYSYIINPFKKRIRSKNGVEAQINVKTTPENHIDILFFTYSEEHPHITFYPDGNGRYFWQRGYNCELRSKLNYDPAIKTISPSEIEITVIGVTDKLFVKLNFDNSTKIVDIVSIEFR